MKADFSVRNNKTIVRYLDLDNNQVTSGQTILNLNLIPVFCDVNNDTFCIDENELQKKDILFSRSSNWSMWY